MKKQYAYCACYVKSCTRSDLHGQYIPDCMHHLLLSEWEMIEGSYFMQGRQRQVAGQKGSINFACWGHT